MIFEFKQKSSDFFVSEQLPFVPTGEGEAFFVYISKRNLTTHDIIDHLRKELGISRMSLGIAWLKDRKAIAKQWISIYDRALTKAGGEKVFLESLSKIVRIVKTTRHTAPLNMSTPITNAFHITFKSTKNLWQKEKQKALEIVQQLLDDGYPNLFGKQRFGINGKNSTQWYELMAGKSKEKFSKQDAVFKLQAYSSKLFNDFVEKRARAGLALLDGDIVTRVQHGEIQYGIYHDEGQTVHQVDIRSDRKKFLFVPSTTGEIHPYDEMTMTVTGPVAGHNCAITDPQTEAGKWEQSRRARHHLDAQSMRKYSSYPVYGLRRPIWVLPTQTKVWYKGDDLLIDFTLPSGSYASLVFDALERALR